MAGGTRHTNFCDNIEAYHNKKKEEQFYDFIIRDKDVPDVFSSWLSCSFIKKEREAVVHYSSYNREIKIHGYAKQQTAWWCFFFQLQRVNSSNQEWQEELVTGTSVTT
ncbi:unnamed protein product [Porites evermanni]|uniref:Uncharacterized protein n=1 Tax=Porites evermanni TaxID=104178 RepID=A0ABN8QP74_9CNID|nr:unnamed protein product [Porites evermanni]